MTIYSPKDAVIIEAPITREAIIKFVLMGDYYIELPFAWDTLINFPRGSYIVYKNRKFEIMSNVRPEFDNNTGGYKYTLQFQAQQNHMKRFVCFWLGGPNPEAVFHNTTDLSSFGALIVANMNKSLGTENWQLGTVAVENPEAAKLVSFNGDKCWDALNTIAETFEVEWWTEENGGMVTLNLGKLEFGTPETFKRGDVVESIPAKKGDDSSYGTRFYVFGSTRNLTSDYGQAEQGGTTNHVSEIRLRLPNGQEYIDAIPDLPEQDIVEQVVFFDDIYPKNTETVTSVEEEIFTPEEGEPYPIYRMVCNNTPFVPSDVIENETLGAHFTSGNLIGMEFELSINYDPATWNPEDGFDKKFEIIAQTESSGDSSNTIPNENMKPEPGDTFVLTGVKLPQQRIDEAEEELLAAGTSYAAKHSNDTDVYDCDTNPVYCQNNDKNYEAGQAVLLVGPQFGDNGRLSRIQGYQKKLYNEYIATYTVGDNTPYSRIGSIESDVKATLYSQRIGVTGSGASIYLITRYDGTFPTDANAYSARRAMWEFANKQTADTFKGRMTFDAGAQFGNFAGGMTGIGGFIDHKGNGELDSLKLRRFLEVPELNYNRVDIVVGDKWTGPSAGVISSVDTETQTFTLKLEDGEIGSPRVGDLCMGIFHSLNPSENATEDFDDSRGNFRFAGFATCYFRIAEILDAEHKGKFRYELRPASESYTAPMHPQPAMTFIGYTSDTDPARRTSRYETRTYQRYLRGVSGWEFTAENIAAQFGDLSNLSVFGLAMSGYSAYLDNIYMQGLLRSLDGTFIIDTKTRSLLMASGETGVGLAFNPEQGLKIGAVYDPETGKFQKEYDIEQIAKTANDTKEELDNLQYSAANIVNASHADWVAAKTGDYGYESGDNLGIDHTLIRGKLITYRVELKGESAEASELGFEIKITYSDGTTQWFTRYTTPYIPDRGTFEKTYTFSSQVQDKEIVSSVLYPVFKSSSGSEVSGKLYIRHEFVGVGNKLPSTWSPSIADQEKYTDEKVDDIQIGGVNLMSNTQHPDPTDTAIWNNNSYYLPSIWGEVGEFTAFKIQHNWGRLWQTIPGGYKAGQQYTFSCMAKRDATQETAVTKAAIYILSGMHIIRASIGGRVIASNTSSEEIQIPLSADIFEKLEVTFVADQDIADGLGMRIEFFAVPYIDNTPCGVVYGYKLETGNKATAWSPSVADQQDAIDAAHQAADDAAAGVNSLKNFTDEAFTDGIVDRSEAASIEKYINSVTETKDAVEASYTVVYENSLLGGTAKSNLHAAKSAFDTAVANLLASVSTASVDGIATAEEKADVDAKYELFNTAYKTYTTRIEEAQKYIQTAINTTAQGAYQLSQELQTVVNNLNESIIPDLQNQIDKQIISYNGTDMPTLSNYPAVEWTTDTERNRHINDYYDRRITDSDGEVSYERYKFAYENNAYQWVRIADSGAAEAQAKALEALGIADSKNKIYYGDTTPAVPYSINDLWIKTSGDIYMCNADRLSGATGSASDWQLVNDAQMRLRQMSSDNVISKEEKASLRNTLAQRAKEMAAYEEDATTYGVSISALNTAYQNLVNFLTGTVAVNNDTDTTLTSEQRASYNGYFASYDTEVSRFMNLVADVVAQQKVDNIQIGGVNLLNDSESITLDPEGGVWGRYNSVATETFEGYKCAVVRNPVLSVLNGAFCLLGKYDDNHITEGSYYTASAYVWANEPVGIRIGLENSEGFVFIIDSTMTGKWIRLSSYQKAVKDNPAFVLYANPTTSTTVVAFRMAQLEDGNKVTAWSPSIADQQAQIADVDYLKDLFPKGASQEVDGAVIAKTLAVNNDDGSQIPGFINGSSNFSDPEHGICMMAMGMSGIAGWETAKTRLYSDGHFVSTSTEITGKIIANSGIIGPFNIATEENRNSLIASNGYGATTILNNQVISTKLGELVGNDSYRFFGVNTSNPYELSRCVVNNKDSSPSSPYNAGLEIEVSGNYLDTLTPIGGIYPGNHALILRSGDTIGFRPSSRVVRISSETISNLDTTIIADTRSNDVNITLPSNPEPNQFHILRKIVSNNRMGITSAKPMRNLFSNNTTSGDSIANRCAIIMQYIKDLDGGTWVYHTITG